MPHRSSVAGSWRLRESRYTLAGSRCSDCSNLHMPPRRVCECGSADTKQFKFTGFGEIVSFTEIHVAPAGFDRNTPYTIALIRLDEGPVISGTVVDKEGIFIGRRVRSVFRRLYSDGEEGVITYGFKFALLEE